LLSEAKSLKTIQRGSSGSSLLRLDGSRDGQAGGWTSYPASAEGLYSLKLKPKGDYQAQVHSDQGMVLVIVRWEAGPAAWWLKSSNDNWKTTIGSKGTKPKIGRVTA
jgi:hypothetical protein